MAARDHVLKNNILTILASLLLASCLFFFNPLFIYYSDPTRFGDLPFGAVLQMVVVVAAVTVGLVWPRARLGSNYTLALCFACTAVILYSYVVQINFGLFRGNRFLDEELISSTARLASFVEPLALGTLFLMVGAIFKRSESFFSIFFALLLLSLSYNLLIDARDSQSVAGANIEYGVQESHMGPGNIFHFSRDRQNIVLVILDAGAGYVLPEIMAENDRAEAFDGFVFYHNTVSIASYTLSSTAALIGGDGYSPDKINQRNDQTILSHIQDAYNWLSGTLAEKGLESTFLNPQFVECDDLGPSRMCGAVRAYKSDLEEHYAFESVSVFDRATLRYFALFKALPFSLKQHVYSSPGWKKAMDGSGQLSASVNMRFHEYLMLKALPMISAVEDDAPGQFSLLWNTELIAPFNLDGDCQPLRSGREDMYSHESRIKATRCVLDAVARWWDWMETNGVYDNTKIVIVSDHGAARYGKDWFKGAAKPLLLVKDFNAAGPLQQSEVLMQNSDVAALICSGLGKCEGVGRDPSKSPIPDRTARYFVTTHGNYEFAKESRRFDIQKSFDVRGSVYDHPELQ